MELEYACDFDVLTNAESYATMTSEKVVVTIDRRPYSFDNFGDRDWWQAIDTHLGLIDINIYDDQLFAYPIWDDGNTDYTRFIYIPTTII